MQDPMKIHLPPTSFPADASREPIGCPDKPTTDYGNWQVDKRIGHWKGIESYTALPVGSSQSCQYILHTPLYPSSEQTLSLLRREWTISRQVINPHLLPVLDANLNDPPYFLVTPHLPGGSLRTLLAQRGKLDLCQALWVLRQAAQALESLHRHGWFTPPLATENIVLAPDGHLTLVGIGEAAELKCTHETDHTERIYADICRLGGLFLETLGNRPRPIEGSDNQDFSSASRNLFRSLPSSVTELVAWMLSRNSTGSNNAAGLLVGQLVRLEIEFLAKTA